MDNQHNPAPIAINNISTRRWKTFPVTIFLLLASVIVNAQTDTGKVQMATGLRSSGKIFVVVAVLLTVLTGLILYLIRLDKKITRLESQAK